MPLHQILPLMIPIIALMIPIVAILTAHQRRMAELIHSNQQNQYNPEVAAMRQEMAELKHLIHQQAISIDNLASRQVGSDSPQSLQNRINIGAG